MSPVCTRGIAPPLQVIVEFDWAWCRFEDRRAGDQVFLGGRRKLFLGWFDLGNSDIPGGIDEFTELSVGDFGLIHPKAIDVNTMDRDRVVGDPGQAAECFAPMIAPHGELTAGDPHHRVGLLALGLCLIDDRRLKTCRQRVCLGALPGASGV